MPTIFVISLCVSLPEVLRCVLAASDRERLARLLAMLGSDHLGEVANAGRLPDRLVRAPGFPDLVTPTLPPPEADANTDPIDVDWHRAAAPCSRYLHLINRWEAEFLAGLPRFPHPSCKQRSALPKIIRRLRACGCAL
jgi:hypothetical protein